MAKVIFGNHSSVIVPRQDRDSIRKFYCDVLGGAITKEENARDFLRLGDDFYIGFLYGDVPDEGDFLRTARSVWLEIKSDNVEETKKKILEFGVRKLDIPEPHLYFQAPGGQVLRLVGLNEDLSFYEGAGDGPNGEKVKEAIDRKEENIELRNSHVGAKASPEETEDGAAAGLATEREQDLPKIATREEWLAARIELLAREKEFDHERDRLTAARRKLPMVKLEKEYVFDGPEGAVTLRDLFEGRRQLIVYHLMFDPARETACKHCSCVMDNIAGSLVHLTARDTSFAAISRAPLAKIEAFKSRMQWTFPWLSSFENDFNYDYHVTLDPDRGSTVYNYRTFAYRGELPGLSVFFRDNNDQIFHTYSTFFRGLDMLLPMYHLLDRTPLGRQEEKGISMADGEDSWIRYHDSYGAGGNLELACCFD